MQLVVGDLLRHHLLPEDGRDHGRVHELAGVAASALPEGCVHAARVGEHDLGAGHETRQLEAERAYEVGLAGLAGAVQALAVADLVRGAGGGRHEVAGLLDLPVLAQQRRERDGRPFEMRAEHPLDLGSVVAPLRIDLIQDVALLVDAGRPDDQVERRMSVHERDEGLEADPHLVQEEVEAFGLSLRHERARERGLCHDRDLEVRREGELRHLETEAFGASEKERVLHV